MKSNLIKLVALTFGLLLFIGANAQTAKIIGADKCKMCHNKPAKGEQYKKWAASGHAKAFTTLSSDKAKEIATKNGVANATTDAKCLACHSVGGLTPKEGVSCEACHGAGSNYKAPSIMSDQKTAITKGLIVPSESQCKKCHVGNKLHDTPDFDFAKFSAKVAHPNPSPKK